MGATLSVSSSPSRATYSRMEFKSRSMCARSSPVNSRLAKSATYATSLSVTFMRSHYIRASFHLQKFVIPSAARDLQFTAKMQPLRLHHKFNSLDGRRRVPVDQG